MTESLAVGQTIDQPVGASNAALEVYAHSELPTEHGTFDLYVIRDAGAVEHTILVMGEVAQASDVLVRLHSECFTGDTLGSLRCDCGDQLHQAMQRIAAAGCGVLIYLRQEGRGVGLGDKIRAYNLQDAGVNTFAANEQLGLPADARDYGVAVRLLQAMRLESIRLLTNNPKKAKALRDAGLTLTAVEPLKGRVNTHNEAYLARQGRYCRAPI